MSRRLSDEANEIVLVGPGGAPTRADLLVHRRLPVLSRRQVRELFASGRVRLNGHPARKGSSVAAGDELVLELPEAERSGLLPDTELRIDVLFEDSTVVGLNKPAGVPTLPLRVGERGTVANFLTARYPDSPLVGTTFEAGLAHRLDTGTSGIILAARTLDAYRDLRNQFRQRRIGKSYLALVHGDLNVARTIDLPIGHSARNAKRMEAHRTQQEADRAGARPALTRVHPVKRFGDMTLVALQIRTGVRHQVRVHLATIGHPIVGDELYAPGALASVCSDVAWTSRPLLHARQLRFTHPAQGEPVRIVAPLPTDLASILAHLEKESSPSSSI